MIPMVLINERRCGVGLNFMSGWNQQALYTSMWQFRKLSRGHSPVNLTHGTNVVNASKPRATLSRAEVMMSSPIQYQSSSCIELGE